MTSSFPIISNLFKILILVLLASCSSGEGRKPRMAEGSISYPFIAESNPLGKIKDKKPLVIKTAVGASEYYIEIPDNAGRYDIQIPLADLSPKGSGDQLLSRGKNGQAVSPATTDKELVAALPSIDKSNPNESAMMDSALGVGTPEGPVQSPSYSLGIARVNQYFKERNFELALVELNHLLSFYPNSPKLLKMKGTLLVKTGNRELALKSWQRAFDLTPSDAPLKKSIDRLNERIVADQKARPQDGGKELISPDLTIPPTPAH